LSEDEDAAEIRIDAVREGDVDDAIECAERNSRLGAIASERPEGRSPWPPARSTTMASRISDIGCPRGADREAAHSNNRSREKDKGGCFEAGEG